ncbi:TlpA disulfide reductase family protein [Sinomicrobium weinanense]|uniref:TlpA family protein disulfide reductase n=2 Tax=Sinomicrobium weinanense TaxID=2842200 RepID=A0A926JTE0_9FLAO|nr:TlpA disulfide reductase family protein [Sinomicrobium weinanense]MBC9796964.1 TlpA family protein disulfide reductase [Sinomicrobium weinanense]MBU3124966.1 TlpA family protein disulfide reductase [Sinomicrobium weinanense]
MSCKNEKPEADQGKTIGSLYISKEKPSPGDSLYIRYTTDKEAPSAYYYYAVHNNMYPVDIPIKDASGKWEGALAIPDSATAVTFLFKAGGEFDSNDKQGFVLPLYTEKGELLKGTLASIASYYQSYYGRSMDVEVERDSSIALFKQEFSAHPDIVGIWDNIYPRILYKENKEEGEKWIKERIAAYQGREKLTDKDYTTLVALHNVTGNDSVAETLTEKSIAAYPKGTLAKRELSKKFYEEKDITKKEELLKEYANSFSDTDGKNFMLYVLAKEYADQNNYEAFTRYADQIPEQSREKTGLYNSVAWKLAEEGKDLDLAAGISKKSLDIVRSLQQNLQDKPDQFSESQYKSNLEGSYRMYADTYAFILFQQGQVKEAVKYQAEAIGEGKSPEVNERYIQFLLADKSYDTAQEKAGEFIREGASTKKIKEYLKSAYAENKGSEEGFDTYLSGLEKVARAKILEEARENMLDEEAPDFILKNLEGKDVALSSMKGKVVILDFWATWCGPCKNSFPGMQNAVTKYENDPNVEFLFVNTWESGKPEVRKKTVKNFINQNKYSFQVLLDTPVTEGSREFDIVDKYGVEGIPTKVIIGPEGRINFRSVGYSGNNEKLVEELDIMIELLQS